LAGKQTKKAAKRAEITDKLADHFLTAGLGDTGLRRLAEVSGTSDRMLLYYFENKDDLVAEVLVQIGTGLRQTLDSAFGTTRLAPAIALASLWEMVKSDEFAPQMRFFFDLSSRAGRGDPLLQTVVTQMGEGWIDWLSCILDVPEDRQRPLASLILGAMDGQVVLFPTDLSQGDEAMQLLRNMLER
jgi:AcrR family transcriptional regulator